MWGPALLPILVLLSCAEAQELHCDHECCDTSIESEAKSPSFTQGITSIVTELNAFFLQTWCRIDPPGPDPFRSPFPNMQTQWHRCRGHRGYEISEPLFVHLLQAKTAFQSEAFQHQIVDSLGVDRDQLRVLAFSIEDLEWPLVGASMRDVLKVKFVLQYFKTEALLFYVDQLATTIHTNQTLRRALGIVGGLRGSQAPKFEFFPAALERDFGIEINAGDHSGLDPKMVMAPKVSEDRTVIDTDMGRLAGVAMTPDIHGRWYALGGGFVTESQNVASQVTGLSYGRNSFLWLGVSPLCWQPNATISTCSALGVVTSITRVASVDLDSAHNISGGWVQLQAPSVPTPLAIGTWCVVKGKGIIVDRHNPHSVATSIAEGENAFRWTIRYSSGVAMSAKTRVFRQSNAILGPPGRTMVEAIEQQLGYLQSRDQRLRMELRARDLMLDEARSLAIEAKQDRDITIQEMKDNATKKEEQAGFTVVPAPECKAPSPCPICPQCEVCRQCDVCPSHGSTIRMMPEHGAEKDVCIHGLCVQQDTGFMVILIFLPTFLCWLHFYTRNKKLMDFLEKRSQRQHHGRVQFKTPIKAAKWNSISLPLSPRSPGASPYSPVLSSSVLSQLSASFNSQNHDDDGSDSDDSTDSASDKKSRKSPKQLSQPKINVESPTPVLQGRKMAQFEAEIQAKIESTLTAPLESCVQGVRTDILDLKNHVTSMKAKFQTIATDQLNRSVRQASEQIQELAAVAVTETDALKAALDVANAIKSRLEDATTELEDAFEKRCSEKEQLEKCIELATTVSNQLDETTVSYERTLSPMVKQFQIYDLVQTTPDVTSPQTRPVTSGPDRGKAPRMESLASEASDDTSSKYLSQPLLSLQTPKLQRQPSGRLSPGGHPQPSRVVSTFSTCIPNEERSHTDISLNRQEYTIAGCDSGESDYLRSNFGNHIQDLFAAIDRLDSNSLTLKSLESQHYADLLQKQEQVNQHCVQLLAKNQTEMETWKEDILNALEGSLKRNLGPLMAAMDPSSDLEAQDCDQNDVVHAVTEILRVQGGASTEMMSRQSNQLEMLAELLNKEQGDVQCMKGEMQEMLTTLPDLVKQALTPAFDQVQGSSKGVEKDLDSAREHRARIHQELMQKQSDLQVRLDQETEANKAWKRDVLVSLEGLYPLIKDLDSLSYTNADTQRVAYDAMLQKQNELHEVCTEFVGKEHSDLEDVNKWKQELGNSLQAIVQQIGPLVDQLNASSKAKADHLEQVCTEMMQKQSELYATFIQIANKNDANANSMEQWKQGVSDSLQALVKDELSQVISRLQTSAEIRTKDEEGAYDTMLQKQKELLAKGCGDMEKLIIQSHGDLVEMKKWKEEIGDSLRPLLHETLGPVIDQLKTSSEALQSLGTPSKDHEQVYNDLIYRHNEEMQKWKQELGDSLQTLIEQCLGPMMDKLQSPFTLRTEHSETIWNEMLQRNEELQAKCDELVNKGDATMESIEAWKTEIINFEMKGLMEQALSPVVDKLQSFTEMQSKDHEQVHSEFLQRQTELQEKCTKLLNMGAAEMEAMKEWKKELRNALQAMVQETLGPVMDQMRLDSSNRAKDQEHVYHEVMHRQSELQEKCAGLVSKARDQDLHAQKQSEHEEKVIKMLNRLADEGNRTVSLQESILALTSTVDSIVHALKPGDQDPAQKLLNDVLVQSENTLQKISDEIISNSRGDRESMTQWQRELRTSWENLVQELQNSADEKNAAAIQKIELTCKGLQQKVDDWMHTRGQESDDSQHNIQELQDQVRVTDRRAASLEKDLEEAQARAKTLQKDLAKAQATIDGFGVDTKRLETELSKARGQEEELRSAVQKAKDDLANGIRTAHDEVAKKIRELEDESAAKSRTLESLVAKHENRAKQLGEEMTRAGVKSDRLENEVLEAQSKAKALEADVADALLRCKRFEEEIKQGEARTRELEDELAGMKEASNHSMAETAKIQHQCAAQLESFLQAQEKVADVCDQLQQSLSSSSPTISSASKQIQDGMAKDVKLLKHSMKEVTDLVRATARETAMKSPSFQSSGSHPVTPRSPNPRFRSSYEEDEMIKVLKNLSRWKRYAVERERLKKKHKISELKDRRQLEQMHQEIKSLQNEMKVGYRAITDITEKSMDVCKAHGAPEDIQMLCDQLKRLEADLERILDIESQSPKYNFATTSSFDLGLNLRNLKRNSYEMDEGAAHVSHRDSVVSDTLSRDDMLRDHEDSLTLHDVQSNCDSFRSQSGMTPRSNISLPLDQDSHLSRLHLPLAHPQAVDYRKSSWGRPSASPLSPLNPISFSSQEPSQSRNEHGGKEGMK